MSLAQRVACLERTRNASLDLVIRFQLLPDAEVAAVRIGDTGYHRRPGETVDALEARALQGRRGVIGIDYLSAEALPPDSPGTPSCG